jgi:hypothetical protein
VRCDSIDCSVLYARVKAAWDLDDVAGIPKLVDALQRHDDVPVRNGKGANARRQVGKIPPEVIEID